MEKEEEDITYERIVEVIPFFDTSHLDENQLNNLKNEEIGEQRIDMFAGYFLKQIAYEFEKEGCTALIYLDNKHIIRYRGNFKKELIRLFSEINEHTNGKVFAHSKFRFEDNIRNFYSLQKDQNRRTIKKYVF